MKTIITAAILLLSSTAYGQVGLNDAIYALQVAAGVRTIPVNTVDVFSLDLQVERQLDGEYVDVYTVPAGATLHLTAVSTTVALPDKAVLVYLNVDPNTVPHTNLLFGGGGYPGSANIDMWFFEGEKLRVRYQPVETYNPVWINVRFTGRVYR